MFITFEGGEGSGKTTQAKMLYDHLCSLGYDCVLTREPGGTFIGSKIRSILLDPENTGLSPKTEFYLYASDRFQHIHEVIRPGLDNGKIVICDRYIDSTSVYQGIVRRVGRSLIESINEQCPRPDITFIMDIDPVIGLKRAGMDVDSGHRDENETRFELESIEFHQKVRNAYISISSCSPDRVFATIDATQSHDEILNKIVLYLDALIAWARIV